MNNWSELKRLAEASRVADAAKTGADEDYLAAAHPETILLLIAEHEQLCAALKAGQGEAVAWANWKVGTKSYIPYRTKEDADRCVRRSEIAATQNGPYKLVPLYTAAPPTPADAVVLRELLEACLAGFDEHWMTSTDGIKCSNELRAMLAQSESKEVKP